MPKITDIVKAKGTRYTLFVDGEYWYIFDGEILAECGLKKGDELTAAQMEEITQKAQRRKARERALYLIGYRDHSRKELFQKLCKSVSPNIALETVNKMQDLGLVNDLEYGRKLARELINVKRVGKSKALYQMCQKGLDKELSQLIIEEMDFDPCEKIAELVQKKYAKYLTDEKGRQKVINALLRLGHSYGNIKSVLNEFEE